MDQAQVLEGGFANASIEAAYAFRAAMQAMAMPGRIYPIGGAFGPAPLSVAAASLVLTLCDPETPLYLAGAYDRPDIAEWVRFHTGAPLVSAARARFAIGSWSELMPLGQYAIGVPEYPDQSATLIVECDDVQAAGAELRGPGLKDVGALNLPELEPIQANSKLFPLGIDFFFTSADRIAGLPRTTKVS